MYNIQSRGLLVIGYDLLVDYVFPPNLLCAAAAGHLRHARNRTFDMEAFERTRDAFGFRTRNTHGHTALHGENTVEKYICARLCACGPQRKRQSDRKLVSDGATHYFCESLVHSKYRGDDDRKNYAQHTHSHSWDRRKKSVPCGASPPPESIAASEYILSGLRTRRQQFVYIVLLCARCLVSRVVIYILFGRGVKYNA